jgi:hypothetical protein
MLRIYFGGRVAELLKCPNSISPYRGPGPEFSALLFIYLFIYFCEGHFGRRLAELAELF